MSKEGRAAHTARTNKAAQRQFGHTKPRLQPLGSGNEWMAEFVSSIQGMTTEFNVNSIIVLQLGDTEAERLVKLRKLSSMGILHMTAHREDGRFVEYRWVLVPSR